MAGLHVDCAQVTVEYDTFGGHDAVIIVPFPNVDPDDGRTVVMTGTIADMRAVIDGWSRLLDDLDDGT